MYCELATLTRMHGVVIFLVVKTLVLLLLLLGTFLCPRIGSRITFSKIFKNVLPDKIYS